MKHKSIPSAGTNAQTPTAAEVPTSSQTCGNTLVVCSLNVLNIETRVISDKTSNFKKALMICFYDEEQKINVLDGLTKEESIFFQNIVSKQIDKGIKIKIDYSYVLV